MIKYIIGILVSFVFTCMFGLNIVLNFMYKNYLFCFLSFTMTICAFAICARNIIDITKHIKENKNVTS